MREIADDLARWMTDGEQVALATVIRAHGPSPRPPGSQMAVSASGEMAGSVSGGCVEGAIVEESRSVLEGGPSKRLRYGVTDEMAWEVGLACGGTIEVYLETLADAHTRVLETIGEDEECALATWVGGRGHLVGWPDGRREGDDALSPALASAFPGPLAELRQCPVGEIFVQVFSPPPTLIIVGAVHIAIPLVKLAQAVGYHVRVVDPRRTFATRQRFPTADEIDLRWPQDALKVEELGPQHAIVILSHDPKFDVPTLAIALRSRAGYVGLLGSPITQAKRRKALAEEGFGDGELSRIHGPVGLDLGGRHPSEIALAVMAEIVADRHGRRGRRPWPTPAAPQQAGATLGELENDDHAQSALAGGKPSD
jgi:xanthine dehydrogenase accessory factor